jgi:predicted TPR repeat methyltransferase
MPTQRHRIQFPPLDATRLPQDEAFFFLERDGQRERIRFHDYHTIYSIPGLYEQLFYDRLQCASPRKMAEILQQSREHFQPLRVLDLGAGNGMMGEELKKVGVSRLVGIDILAEAFEACERDRPGIYDGYYVEDLCTLDAARREEIASWQFDCLTTVAALGFGDIPREVFVNAYNLVQDGGWIAFNIKEDFLKDRDPTGFSSLVRALILSEEFDLYHLERYRHRLSIEGTPLHYLAIVGRKRGVIDSALGS